MFNYPYKSFRKEPRIAGAGAALVDILLTEEDVFLEENEVIRGGMELVDSARIAQLLERSGVKPATVPGGSACNTITGTAMLGINTVFTGSLGDDQFGDLFRSTLKANGIKPVLFKKDTPTGQALSIVTADAERSMCTFLGASSHTVPADYHAGIFEDVDIVHIEGYLFFNRDLIYAVARRAREAGALVALDLASFNVIDSDPEAFRSFVHEYVDIAFANEEEARSYTGCKTARDAVDALRRDCSIAVVKLGKEGSLIQYGDHLETVDVYSDGRPVIDTTGAGDLWAAGFLATFVRGGSLKECGRSASRCAYEVCCRMGARIPDEIWQELRRIQQ
ncbi:MAG: adenosine kinase [Fibrobacterota bacterium]